MRLSLTLLLMTTLVAPAGAATVTGAYLEPAPYARADRRCCPTRAEALGRVRDGKRCGFRRRGGAGGDRGGASVSLSGGAESPWLATAGVSEFVLTGPSISGSSVSGGGGGSGGGTTLETTLETTLISPVTSVPGPVAGSGLVTWLLLLGWLTTRRLRRRRDGRRLPEV